LHSLTSICGSWRGILSKASFLAAEEKLKFLKMVDSK
jgi:hypothetical protein